MKKSFLYVLLAIVPICLLSCSKSEDDSAGGDNAVTKEFLIGHTWTISEMYARSYDDGKLRDETHVGPGNIATITMDFYENGTYEEYFDGGEDYYGDYILGDNGVDIVLTAYDEDTGVEYSRSATEIHRLSNTSFKLIFYSAPKDGGYAYEEERIFTR